MPSVVKGSKTVELRENITNRIIEAIEAGTPPWRQPWQNDPNYGFPTNFVSQRHYHGVNSLLLMMQGYCSKFWGTVLQWNNLGAQVPVAEIPCQVLLFLAIEIIEKGKKKKIPLIRNYEVYNADQVRAIPLDALTAMPKPKLVLLAKSLLGKRFDVRLTRKEIAERVYEKVAARLAKRQSDDTVGILVEPTFEPAEQLLKASKADIRHGGSNARYYPSGDYIELPHKRRFDRIGDYYEVAFHELVHWTAQEKRVPLPKTLPYAMGELIAEIGACFLAMELGVPLAEEFLPNHQAYVGNWLKEMGGNPKYIFDATRYASRATDYLLNFLHPNEVS